MATSKKNFSLFQIMFGILWIAMGLEGFAGGTEATASIGHFYYYLENWFGKAGEAICAIVGVLILVSGIVYLLSLFASVVPAKVVKYCMVFLIIIWLIVLVLDSVVYGLGHINGFAGFLNWVVELFINLLILSATVSFCGETALKG